ncbi:Hypothetical Protein FCC1311_041012, partial [Hondaea fermentalgiana]
MASTEQGGASAAADELAAVAAEAAEQQGSPRRKHRDSVGALPPFESEEDREAHESMMYEDLKSKTQRGDLKKAQAGFSPVPASPTGAASEESDVLSTDSDEKDKLMAQIEARTGEVKSLREQVQRLKHEIDVISVDKRDLELRVASEKLKQEAAQDDIKTTVGQWQSEEIELKKELEKLQRELELSQKEWETERSKYEATERQLREQLGGLSSNPSEQGPSSTVEQDDQGGAAGSEQSLSEREKDLQNQIDALVKELRDAKEALQKHAEESDAKVNELQKDRDELYATLEEKEATIFETNKEMEQLRMKSLKVDTGKKK